MTSPRDYRNTHTALSTDIQTMLLNHPDSFEALLYLADTYKPETVAEYVDVVGSLDTSERTLEYSDPTLCRAMIIPDFTPFNVTIDGNNLDGELVEPVVLILSVENVPQQSVVQWLEYIDSENIREVSLYVLKSEQIGVAPGVVTKLYSIPMQAFTGLENIDEFSALAFDNDTFD